MDGSTATGLTTAADALVRRLGVSGQHPGVQAAVGPVLAASAARDTAALRAAATAFEAVVRRLAGPGEWVGGQYLQPPTPAEPEAERRYEAEERSAIAEFGDG